MIELNVYASWGRNQHVTTWYYSLSQRIGDLTKRFFFCFQIWTKAERICSAERTQSTARAAAATAHIEPHSFDFFHALNSVDANSLLRQDCRCFVKHCTLNYSSDVSFLYIKLPMVFILVFMCVCVLFCDYFCCCIFHCVFVFHFQILCHAKKSKQIFSAYVYECKNDRYIINYIGNCWVLVA